MLYPRTTDLHSRTLFLFKFVPNHNLGVWKVVSWYPLIRTMKRIIEWFQMEYALANAPRLGNPHTLTDNNWTKITEQACLYSWFVVGFEILIRDGGRYRMHHECVDRVMLSVSLRLFVSFILKSSIVSTKRTMLSYCAFLLNRVKMKWSLESKIKIFTNHVCVSLHCHCFTVNKSNISIICSYTFYPFILSYKF